MNKIYAVSALIIASITFASAEDVVVKNNTVRGSNGMVRATEVKSVSSTRSVITGTAKLMPSQGSGVSQGQVQVVRMMPPIAQMTTGDPSIDAQLKVLLAEKDAKIKAIEEEYMVKIKAIIGTHSLNKIEGEKGNETKDNHLDVKNNKEKMISDYKEKQNQETERLEKMKSASHPSEMPVFDDNKNQNENQKPTTQVGRPVMQTQEQPPMPNQPSMGGIKALFRGFFGDGN